MLHCKGIRAGKGFLSLLTLSLIEPELLCRCVIVLPRIVDVSLEEVLVRVKGVFRIAYSAASETPILLVKVKLDDGTIGVGEAGIAGKVTWENTLAAQGYVAQLRQRLIGMNMPKELGKALRVVHSYAPGFSATRAGLEEALLDASAQATGVDVGLILGGLTARKLYTDYTVSIPVDEVLGELREGRHGENVVAFIESIEYLAGIRDSKPSKNVVPLPELTGFHALKVKVGTGDPGLDVELVKLVYEASRGRVKIRVDANQAWTPKTAVKTIKKLENILSDILELVEQPVPATDLEGLAYVAENTGVPIAADESARSIYEVAVVAKRRAADIVNIKIAKIGGPLQAARATAIAQGNGLGVMWGCMLESGYGISYAAYAALATGYTSIVDLDSPLFLEEPPGSDRAVYGVDSHGVYLEPRTPTRREQGK